jgi:hypothetical protein
MLSNLPHKALEQLTVKDLEELLELKKRNTQIGDLLKERERLRLELRRVEDCISAMEKASASEAVASSGAARVSDNPEFLHGRRRKNLKDYIAQVLSDAGEALSPTEIQRRLTDVGYVSTSTNPRSFYNTVFQALQRYDAFERDGRKYRLTDRLAREDSPSRAILPRKKTRLKDFIVEVLGQSPTPLKVSEIASRVIIAGYETDLSMDELCQRVSATLKKYLNTDFEWDSQRYRLLGRS